LEKFWKITIHVPILGASERPFINRFDPPQSEELSAVLEAIKSIPQVGRIGNYDGVYELSIGFEGYLPREGAIPRYGSVGKNSNIRSIAVTTYISCKEDQKIIDHLVDAVRRFHPWEHPIVETTECLLYVPGRR
jgi:hypothetical protein